VALGQIFAVQTVADKRLQPFISHVTRGKNQNRGSRADADGCMRVAVGVGVMGENMIYPTL